MRGNCYAAAEALFHITGGYDGPWRPQVMRVSEDETHWFLRHCENGEILDPSAAQFLGQDVPDYTQGRGCGFLTKKPSKKARQLIEVLSFQ